MAASVKVPAVHDRDQAAQMPQLQIHNLQRIAALIHAFCACIRAVVMLVAMTISLPAGTASGSPPPGS